MEVFAELFASTTHAEICEVSVSIHVALIVPEPFHVPLATKVRPSFISLVNVPVKSIAEAIPSLTNVPFWVNLTSPSPCKILVSSVVNEPLVVVIVTSSAVPNVLLSTISVSTKASPSNNSSPLQVTEPEIPELDT